MAVGEARQGAPTPAHDVTLQDKLRFLSAPASYAERPAQVEVRQTHMSWVFLLDTTVYKLKKPVTYPFLDFSTLAAREADCRDELRLNRRLAPAVYLGLSRLLRDARGRLSLAAEEGGGAADGRHTRVVDWLVRMRRLPDDRTMERLIERAALTAAQVQALGETLASFYRHLPPADISAAQYLASLWEQHRLNRATLTDQRFALDGPCVQRVLAAIDHGFEALRNAMRERVASGRVVEGHGDLRPDHVFLTDPPVVIDCLEFNRALRLVDWVDEIAFLALECERLGAPWVGAALRDQIAQRIDDAVSDELFHFYTALRACLRARLALAHLDEPAPRLPQRWWPLARDYLAPAISAVERIAAPAGPTCARALTPPGTP